MIVLLLVAGVVACAFGFAALAATLLDDWHPALMRRMADKVFGLEKR